MLDFILGLFLAALAVRGWLRGFVKEAFDLVGLALGVFMAFRLAAPLGDFFAERFGVTPEWARVGAGITLFLLVGVVLSIASNLLGRVVRLPGLNLANRLGGSALAALWGALLLSVIVTLLRVLPIPAVEEQVENSVVAATLAGPAQEAIGSLVDDPMLDSLLALESSIGTRRVVLEGDERVDLEPVEAEDLAFATEEAREIYRLINQTRLEVGVDPLSWSDGLAMVASGQAREMYSLGYVSHLSPVTGRVTDRVAGSGIPLAVVGENLALAGSIQAVHEGLMASPSHRANILNPSFDRVGVGVVRGPYGLMVVQVFGG
ncbi:MAG TPA: CvpA family protein [Acidimicrobiia bacterium]